MLKKNPVGIFFINFLQIAFDWLFRHSHLCKVHVLNIYFSQRYIRSDFFNLISTRVFGFHSLLGRLKETFVLFKNLLSSKDSKMFSWQKALLALLKSIGILYFLKNPLLLNYSNFYVAHKYCSTEKKWFYLRTEHIHFDSSKAKKNFNPIYCNRYYCINYLYIAE